MGQFLDGTPWPMMPICLLEFGMDDGITALGEVGRGVSLKMLEESLGRAVGMEFSGISTAGAPAGLRSGAMWGLVQAHPPALWQAASPLLPAIEMATLDWAGKRLGCRAVDLLGGAYAESVPVDYWSGRKTPKDLAKTVEVARERGFTGIKMKSRIGDPAAEQVRAVRDAAGADFRVTIDPMFQWLSPHEAAGTFRSL
jgi:L-alanine-DL-glutamate epimerase-like enolase superfamily enzyme